MLGTSEKTAEHRPGKLRTLHSVYAIGAFVLPATIFLGACDNQASNAEATPPPLPTFAQAQSEFEKNCGDSAAEIARGEGSGVFPLESPVTSFPSSVTAISSHPGQDPMTLQLVANGEKTPPITFLSDASGNIGVPEGAQVNSVDVKVPGNDEWVVYLENANVPDGCGIN